VRREVSIWFFYVVDFEDVFSLSTAIDAASTNSEKARALCEPRKIENSPSLIGRSTSEGILSRVMKRDVSMVLGNSAIDTLFFDREDTSAIIFFLFATASFSYKEYRP
jgi:hypothetical protein